MRLSVVVAGRALAARVLAAWALAAAPACAAAPLNDLEWEQHPGAPVPMDAPFTAADGAGTTLRQAAGGLPLVLAPGYYRCPNLCGIVRQDLADALDRSGLHAGRDYQVAVLSIDPSEGPADAAAVKDAGFGWRLLTGPADAVGGAIGFRTRFDEAQQQFIHPAGVAVLSPSGLVSGYVLGVGYDPGALRSAILLARDGGQAAANPVLLLCFHYDPATGRYTLAVERLVRIGGTLTALGLGTMLWLTHRPRRLP